jgi:hypothetical protein
MPPRRRGRFKLQQVTQQPDMPAQEAVSQDEDIVPPSQPQHELTITAEIHSEPYHQPESPQSLEDIHDTLTIPDPPKSSKSSCEKQSSSCVDIVQSQSQSQSQPSQSLLKNVDTIEKRKFGREPRYIFSDNEEQDIVQWLQENPILYNKKLREFSTGGPKKKQLWETKAAELGCTATQLFRWWESMRTMYGKLSKTQSGQAAPNLTERQKWIVDTFVFMRPHIVRVPSRSSKVCFICIIINYISKFLIKELIPS